jgi:polyribonucleotide nucleotidyltransferase
MRVIMVPTDKIRDVIGKGGPTVRGIVEETGADIDIQDDGSVRIYASDAQSLQAAVTRVEEITAGAEIGAEVAAPPIQGAARVAAASWRSFSVSDMFSRTRARTVLKLV